MGISSQELFFFVLFYSYFEDVTTGLHVLITGSLKLFAC